MADKYIVNLTDPLSPNFSIRAFTSNGPLFPITTTLNQTAVSSATSLLLYGKGHPGYGERIQENLVHLLENFSGSTEPKNPTSGQIWFSRTIYIQTGEASPNNWYRWEDADNSNGGSWISFIPAITEPSPIPDGGYWFNGSSLFLGVNNSTHPLSPTWIERDFQNASSLLSSPDASVHNPEKVLKIFDGVAWKPANTVFSSPVEPTGAADGDLWFDSGTDNQLKIRVSSVWVSVADNYVLKSGDTMSGTLNMDTNEIIGLPAVPSATAAASKEYVDDQIASVGGGATTLSGLTDVDATLVASTFLKVNAGGTAWDNATLILDDITDVSVTSTEVNHLAGVSSNVQTQLNNKLNLSGGTLTGALILNADPTSNLESATKQYVDNAIDGVLISGSWTASTYELQLDTSAPSTITIDLSHDHPTDQINHTTGTDFLRDLFWAEPTFPSVELNTVLEDTFENVNDRLSYQESSSAREVFVVSGSPQTNFTLTDAEYRVGSNRLQVFVNGQKYYANERAYQAIYMRLDKNLSVTSSTGLANDATTYTLDIAVDGAVAQTMTATGADLQTIQDIINEITLQITGVTAVWNKARTAIFIWSNTTGNGSQVTITDTGLLSSLAGVGATSDLPIFSDNETSGFQTVGFDPNITGGDPTGLTNDATVYTANVDVDGVSNPLSITGSAAQTFTDLVNEINLDLSGATATINSGNILITSDSTGLNSTIEITDTDLFSSLTNFDLINSSVDGNSNIAPAANGALTQITQNLGYTETGNTFTETKYGSYSSSIQFTDPLPVGTVVEMIVHPDYLISEQ